MITPSLRYEALAYQSPAAHAGITALSGEIAERLEELEELKLCSSSDLITMLADVHRISPWMYRIVIALMHGRTEAVTHSVNALAHKRGITKQAVHAEYHTQLRQLTTQFPALAVSIEQIRASATIVEQPQSHADALRQSVEVTHEF